MKLNKYIDHTILKADATPEQIVKLCEEAKQYDFMSVCVNPAYVPLASRELKGSSVLVCTVVGFPLGMNLPETKAEEARFVIKMGAQEVDMVINVGRLKARDDKFIEDEIRLVKHACGDVLLKVIIEACLLTDDEKVRACLAAKKAGADYVKTSTGFSTGGATAADIALMRKTVGQKMGVKASGGVRNKADALLMIQNGASRIGTSGGVKIVSEE